MIAFKVVKGKLSKKNMFCNVEILFKQKSKTVKALIDSGNLLKDPLTNVPVVVVEAEELKTLIPEEILEHIGEIIGGGSQDCLGEPQREEYISKFRVIPFSSLGKKNGMLLGFKADYLLVDYEENIHKIENAIIGIYGENFTKSKEYTAIIGLDILEGSEEENEHTSNVKIEY